MRKSRAVAAGILAIGLLVPRPASADADKEHKLLMAEIRMLQEEQQQLRAVLLGLGDTLKALNSRLDADAARAQKSFADQKLVVEGVAETTRILREKADETNVRLSSMTQELQSLRQTVASMPPPAAVVTLPAPGDPAAADPAASAAGSPDCRPPATTTAVERVADADVGPRLRCLHGRTVGSGRRRIPVVHPDLPHLAAGRRCAVVHRPFALQRRQVPRGRRPRCSG